MARFDPKPVDSITARQAREIFVRAQGLDRPPNGEAGIDAMLRRLGAVQLDTISVLARSHELVAYARLGPIQRAQIEAAYWSEPASAFEYTGHAACIMPIDLWPYFAFRRRARRERERASRVPEPVFEEAWARLRDGPVMTSDLGGGRRSGGWWNWSAAKVALEVLYRRGEIAVTVRRGWKRIYDLPERVVPAELLAHEPSDAECYERLVNLSARALGVGTARDIANYFLLSTPYAGVATNARRLIAECIEASGFVPVSVEGWPETAFADPAALESPDGPPARTALLSPFDSLIWATPQAGELKERERIRRVFGFSYSFEAYVRAPDRVHGYFTMPLLVKGRLAGRVDPKREGRTLVAAAVSLETPDDLEPMAAALVEAAAWVNCNSIRIDRVTPPELSEPLRRLVA
jgi:uncharacterized protein